MSYRAEKLVIGTRMEIRMDIRHYDPQLCQTKTGIRLYHPRKCAVDGDTQHAKILFQ